MKYKCDVCGEEHDKVNIMIECSDCYVRGWKKEFKKQQKLDKEENKKVKNGN